MRDGEEQRRSAYFGVAIKMAVMIGMAVTQSPTK
jgi:hypothetical protein